MFHHLPPSSRLSYGNNSNFTTKQRLHASSSPLYFSLSVSPYFSLWLYHFYISIFLSSGFYIVTFFNLLMYTYTHSHNHVVLYPNGISLPPEPTLSLVSHYYSVIIISIMIAIIMIIIIAITIL